MGAFLHRNKHDVGNTESSHNDGEDPDEESCNFQHRKELIELVIDDAGVSETKYFRYAPVVRLQFVDTGIRIAVGKINNRSLSFRLEIEKRV